MRVFLRYSEESRYFPRQFKLFRSVGSVVSTEPTGYGAVGWIFSPKKAGLSLLFALKIYGKDKIWT